VGGFFIGTTTNAYELVKRLRQSSDQSFGNEIYKISFDASQDKNEIDLFGVKFDFHLDSVVNCPEYLLNFDVLIKLAEKHNLKFVFKKSFAEFFEENSKIGQNKELISIMRALEPYYPNLDDCNEEESKIRENLDDYSLIESRLADETFKNDLKHNETYATLSKSEWEAITLYMAFAFEKIQNTDQDPSKPVKRKLSE
jgi:mRNA (guanine-N7-)-methyltransferase